ncbi:endolytic transglycosylase MltG [Brevibacillus marinus]|uniref:endolytic transglycosylase MltG n=1 Tax=Brevibacillus marinus TaxID=2496837 RepID=UPI000F84D245|nr:endolytic transglycosylase MltG [Brevibacillus marinus]
MISRQAVLGFGFGLLFAAGFLYVYPPETSEPPQLTPEALEAAAKAQHKVILSEEEYRQLRSQADGGGPAAAERPAAAAAEAGSAGRPAGPQDASGNEADGPSAQPSASRETAASVPKPAAQAKQAASAPAAKPTYRKTKDGVLVTITGGMTSAQIADLLAASGVITDKTAFLEQLWSANKHRDVRAGTYHFANGTDVQELIRRLTTLPER